MKSEQQILALRDKVLGCLKGKVNDFALGGGTVFWIQRLWKNISILKFKN